MNFFLIPVSLFSLVFGSPLNSVSLDTYQIEKSIKMKGAVDPQSGAYRITVPATNLKAGAAGIQLTPSFGLASWVDFIPHLHDVEIKGEFVLLEDQINLILQMVLDQGLTPTFLHNLHLWDSPRLMIMGIEGKGDVQELGAHLDKLFQTLKTSCLGTIWRKPPAIIHPEKSTLTSKLLEDLFEKKADKKEGVTSFKWENETYAVFSGTDRETAMLGSFTLSNENMGQALQLFLKKNIYILSLRPHTSSQNPSMTVIRFLGRGPILDLGHVLKEVVALNILEDNS